MDAFRAPAGWLMGSLLLWTCTLMLLLLDAAPSWPVASFLAGVACLVLFLLQAHADEPEAP